MVSGPFSSVGSGGTLHFYLFFFPLMNWQGLKFWYDYYGVRLGKQSPGKKLLHIFNGVFSSLLEI